MRKYTLYAALLTLMVILASCSGVGSENAASEQANENNEVNSAEQENEANEDSVSMDDLDPDDEMTPFIQRGEALLDGTAEEADDKSSNKLSCMSCHAAGDDSNGVSFAGITKEYPKYDERKDAVITLEEKINDSITRTLDGEKLDYDGEEMRSIIAYLTYISKGADSETFEDKHTVQDIPEPDVKNGKKVYEGKIKGAAPVLWGDESFTDASNMNRMSVMTNYVKDYLPQDDAGSLSDQEAADVAAYVLSKDRPQWKEDKSDWSDGKPADFIQSKDQEAIQNGNFNWKKVNGE